jgi:hypothetical protein
MGLASSRFRLDRIWAMTAWAWWGVRGDVLPSHRKRRFDRRRAGRSQNDVRAAAAPPPPRHRREHVRRRRDQLCLLLRDELEHGVSCIRISDGREHLSADAEIRVSHVRGLGGVRQGQCQLAKFFGGHESHRDGPIRDLAGQHPGCRYKEMWGRESRSPRWSLIRRCKPILRRKRSRRARKETTNVEDVEIDPCVRARGIFGILWRPGSSDLVARLTGRGT